MGFVRHAGQCKLRARRYGGLSVTEEELTAFPKPVAADAVPHHVARQWDLAALARKTPAKVIGENAILRDRPGFGVGFITNAPGDTMSIPEKFDHAAVPPMTGEAAMYHAIGTVDPAGAIWQG